MNKLHFELKDESGAVINRFRPDSATLAEVLELLSSHLFVSEEEKRIAREEAFSGKGFSTSEILASLAQSRATWGTE